VSRRAVTVAVAALASVPVGGAAFWTSQGATEAAPAALPAPAKIVFVDVGQGDGVAMRIGGKIVLSDAGELNVDAVERTLVDLGARSKTIDVAILSHPHDDHVANYVRLVRDLGWHIRRAVLSTSAYWAGTDTNAELIALLRKKRTQLDFVARGDRLRIGGAEFEIMNPPPKRFTGGASEAANASVAYLLRVNGATALFTGDVEPNVARRLAVDVTARVDERIDLFLATHHGSKHGSIPELLTATRPRHAVLSVGRNRFGHPARQAVARLKQAAGTLWCTAANGTVAATIATSGRITVTGERQAEPWWVSRTRTRTGVCTGRR
jgi:competence protein ComEC